jgi:hypothetical protein
MGAVVHSYSIGTNVPHTEVLLSGETYRLCCKYKQYIAKHNSINDFIKVYFLHCFIQRHVSALVMSHLLVDYFS